MDPLPSTPKRLIFLSCQEHPVPAGLHTGPEKQPAGAEVAGGSAVGEGAARRGLRRGVSCWLPAFPAPALAQLNLPCVADSSPQARLL